MGVYFEDVGFLAELADDVDRLQHLCDDLGWKRNIGRYENTDAEGEPDADRQNADAKTPKGPIASPTRCPVSGTVEFLARRSRLSAR